MPKPRPFWMVFDADGYRDRRSALPGRSRPMHPKLRRDKARRRAARAAGVAFAAARASRTVMTSFGPVHKLIVHEVGDDDAPYYINDFEDYEVEHTSECECSNDGWWRCGVGNIVENVGVRFSLRYSGTPVIEPGEYHVQAWSVTYRGFDCTDYDGGIAVIGHE